MEDSSIEFKLFCGECGSDSEIDIEDLHFSIESTSHDEHSHGSIVITAYCKHCNTETEITVREW